MATSHPRIQVTVDPELAGVLAMVDPSPASRSRLVRDLAVRGAEVVAAEREAALAAPGVLLAIADGEGAYDLEAAAALHAQRADQLP